MYLHVKFSRAIAKKYIICGKDGKHDMQTVPRGRQPFRGGVWTQYDGGGADIPRETQRAGRVRGPREGDDGRVAGSSLDGTSWEGKGGKVELDQRIHGRRWRVTTHLSDRVPHQKGDKGMSSGGLPGKGRDADGNEGVFLAQTCLERRDHLGGGKPPTSKVLTMRHAGSVSVPKRETQENRDVQEWVGEEETATGGGRDMGKHGDGLRGLREVTQDGEIF